tara:strand:+ start:3408 stop:5915 length:2508 start_codon:yes stop_codon:yes gene_type:complete
LGDFDFSQWDFADPADASINDLFNFGEQAVGFSDVFSADFVPNYIFQYDEYLQGHAQVPVQNDLQGQSPEASSSRQQQYRAPSNPTFDNTGVIDPALLAQQPVDTGSFDPNILATPGLTAVPGANDFMPTQPMQYQPFPIYPDPSIMYQPQPLPYCYPQGYIQTGYTPIEQQLMQPAQQPAQQSMTSPRKSKRRTQPDSDSEDDVAPVKRQRVTQPAKYTSEDESDDYKVAKPIRTRKPERTRRISRESGVSSNSSLGKPKQHAVAHAGERPQKCEDKPWIRINNNTKGETTRTARINGEANELRKYKSKPLPHGDWNSRKYQFEYSNHGGLDEFKKKKMPARQIFEYITQYPSDDLRLWLQVSPADMARRYGSPAHSKCLFENCPKHIWGDSGTIDVGHYRVAFDEKYKTYGNKVVDPFDCPGYVHLYCLERFCDFEAICQVADVQADTRVDLPREAGQAKWTMSGRPELELAQYFLKACKKDKLRQTDDFAQYPIHTSSSAPKQFDRTLVHALSEVNVANRTRSQMRQFIERKLTPNVLMINKGDMEMAMTLKKIKASKVYKKALKSRRATAATFNFEALYDEYDPIINERIAQYRALKDQFEAEDATGRAPKKSKSKAKKRKRAVRDEDSDSEPDLGQDSDIQDIGPYPQPYPPYPQQQQPGTRSSPRKRHRVNYGVDIDDPPQPHIAPPRSSGPQYYENHGYAPARLSSLSALFPKDFTYDLDEVAQAQPTEPPLLQSEFEEFMRKVLERRKSSTMSNGLGGSAGVMKAGSPRSPEFRRVMARASRQASFNAQPVTSSKEYNADDPPNALVATPTGTRRSSRLASMSVSES